MDEKAITPVKPSKKSSRKKREDDLGHWFQEYIGDSRSPEETLFKINELLASGVIPNTRKNLRAPISITVSFKVDEEINVSRTYTLSSSGLFLKWPRPPALGAPIEMEIHLPDRGDVVAADGVVVQSVPMEVAAAKGILSGMSVVFNRIKSEDRRRLERLVRFHARRLRKKYAP